MDINGFAVVRVPHLNFQDADDVVPCLNGLYYAGVDRQRWADVYDEEFYAKKSPPEITRLSTILKNASNDFTGIDLCTDRISASKLLVYSNRKALRNELIAIRSPGLNELKPIINVDIGVDWMGFDFVALGDWSLIAAGLFMYPDHYSSWLPLLNRHGLFDGSKFLAEYAREYDRAVELGQSEPIASKSAGFETVAIEVGRVNLI